MKLWNSITRNVTKNGKKSSHRCRKYFKRGQNSKGNHFFSSIFLFFFHEVNFSSSKRKRKKWKVECFCFMVKRNFIHFWLEEKFFSFFETVAELWLKRVCLDLFRGSLLYPWRQFSEYFGQKFETQLEILIFFLLLEVISTMILFWQLNFFEIPSNDLDLVNKIFKMLSRNLP